jgi:transposase-like protein
MTQYQITLDSNILHQLFLGGAGDSGMKPLLESVFNQILQAQAAEQLAAAPYERTDDRKGYRNGSYPHCLSTRVGTLTLRIPRLRDGSFSTDLFARYQRSEQAFLLALMEMVLQGVSTRKVSEVTEELCGSTFSKSTVSELCKRLDPIVYAWNQRSLRDQRFPFVLVDALVIKIREDARIRPRGILIATGVNEGGQREILGFLVGDSESEASWSELFQSLKQRGLHGMDLVVSDQHSGLVCAVRRQFQGVVWQRCQTHFLRNVLGAAPKSQQAEIHSQVRAMLDAPNIEIARQLLTGILEKFSSKAPKAMDVLEKGAEDALAVLALPEYYRRRLRTTNSVERLNEEIRRRERVIRIFPNRASAERLIGALLMEFDDKWAGGKKHLEMTAYFNWCQEQSLQATQKVVRII